MEMGVPGATLCAGTPPASLEVGMKKLEVLERLPDASPHALRFRARQVVFQREVEMRLLPEGADKATQALFLREIQELLLIDHPTYLPVIDYGSTQDRPYYAVLLRQGVPLTELLDSEEIGLAERCRMVRALADGMAAAHLAGIRLGPPSPAHIRWDAARRQVHFLHHKLPAGVGLELDRAAPEDVRPEAGPSAGADVYHWAHLAYWWITGGKPAYGGPTQIPIRLPVPTLGRDLAHLIEASLHEDPTLRPANLEEVRSVLDTAEEDVVPEDSLDLEASGIVPAERISDTLKNLRLQNAIREVPKEREISVPEVDRFQLFDGPLPSFGSLEVRPGPMAVALGFGSVMLVAGAAFVLGKNERAPPPARAPVAAPVPDAATATGDPYLPFLLRQARITPLSFRTTLRMVRGVAKKGILPEELSEEETFDAMLARFQADAEAGCRELDAYLGRLRKAFGAQDPVPPGSGDSGR